MKSKFFLCSFLVALFTLQSSVSSADSLSEAAAIQTESYRQERDEQHLNMAKVNAKEEMNIILQSLFYQYYQRVKASGLNLINAQEEVRKLNERRRSTGGCCDILLMGNKENGNYVITTDKEGIFAIDGYGLQSVSGNILDEQYNQTGVISPQCIYEVSISYKNSRTYKCSNVLARTIDSKIVDDMIEMLPVAMKNYHR
ncbi:hypothetical protein [Pseudomonas fragi]|uniref:hypothetical protein n=1 Tax=Pseudomonas fragi TaxID=296 RepID=UPI0029549959|nr:hypothetical protein [Pseudomonas fragi]WOL28227.1 hypothetical protein Q1A94_00880 [Pseudomonas fragi]